MRFHPRRRSALAGSPNSNLGMAISMLQHDLLGQNPLDFCRTEVSWVNLYYGFSVLYVDTLLLDTRALPAAKRRDQYSGARKCQRVIRTGFGFREHRRTSQQILGQGGFHQWQGRSPREHPAGASSTFLRRSHELSKNQNGILKLIAAVDRPCPQSRLASRLPR